MRKIFVLLIASIGAVLIAGAILSNKAQAATYYVADDIGDDSRTTVQAQVTTTPWKTIQKAADNTVAGDIVNVKGGLTYTGSNVCTIQASETAVTCIKTNAGSAGSPITYQAWPGTGIPVIDVTGTSNAFGITKDYITISGFKIINVPSSGVDNPRGIIALDFSDFSINNLIIKNNIFYNSHNGLAVGLGSNIEIYNNLFIDITYLALGIDVITNANIKNNIIVNNDQYGLSISGSTGTYDYNLIWNNGTNYNGLSPGAHDISVDPLLTDPANGDFTQTALSPTINAGTTVTGVTIDIEGNPRPGGGTYDIGAYEYKDFYVAGDTGNDSGKGTISDPWLTIQKAADVMIAGDTVNVKGGVIYTGSKLCYIIWNAVVCTVNSGTAGNSITYQSWSGTGIPIIDAQNQKIGFGATIGHNYINIEGFKVINFSYIGILFVGGYINVTNNITVIPEIADPAVGGIVGGGLGSCTDRRVYNNTTYAIGDHLSDNSEGIHFEGTTCVSEAKNNIMMNVHLGLSDGSANSTSTGDYNLYWNNTTNYYTISGDLLQGPNDITGQDPLLVDPANSDFRLSSISSAIDSGTNIASVTTDILGMNRPMGLRTDIGAYEYYVPTGSLNPPTEPEVEEGETVVLTGSAGTTSPAVIATIEYSLDGGKTWVSSGVTAVDGSLDETNEDYTITLTNLPPGDYSLTVRITDNNGYTYITDERTFVIEAVTLPSTGDNRYLLLFGGMGELVF